MEMNFAVAQCRTSSQRMGITSRKGDALERGLIWERMEVDAGPTAGIPAVGPQKLAA